MMITRVGAQRMILSSVEGTKLLVGVIFAACGIWIALTSLSNIPAVLAGGVFLVAGGFVMSDVGFMRIILDRMGSSMIAFRRLRTGVTTTVFAAQDVLAVRRYQYVGFLKNGSTGQVDQLFLFVKDSEPIEVSLTAKTIGWPSRWLLQRRMDHQGRKIALFLGISYELKKVNVEQKILHQLAKDEHRASSPS